MSEQHITVENAYMQQNYLIQLCMDCTDRLNELEAKYQKMQAGNWRHRAKQLKAANHTPCITRFQRFKTALIGTVQGAVS